MATTSTSTAAPTGTASTTGTTTPSYSDIITQAYLAELGRTPDPQGFQYYLDAMNAGTLTQQQLINEINTSPEGYVFDLYANLLGRTPDPAAKYWVDAIVSGNMTNQQVRDSFLASSEYQTYQQQQADLAAAQKAEQFKQSEVLRMQQEQAAIEAQNAALQQQRQAAMAAAQQRFQGEAIPAGDQNIFGNFMNPTVASAQAFKGTAAPAVDPIQWSYYGSPIGSAKQGSIAPTGSALNQDIFSSNPTNTTQYYGNPTGFFSKMT